MADDDARVVIGNFGPGTSHHQGSDQFWLFV